MPNMASAESAEEFVNVPRGKYQKAVSTMLQQREHIKQQELKLKALNNLFVLLQTKDNDLRRSKETEASLRVALRRTEAVLQKTLAENFFAKSKVPASAGTKSRLEADSAPLGEWDDMEADGAAPAQPFKDRLSDYSKPSNEPSPHSPVCTSQTQSSVLPSITVGGSSRSRNPVSKDLVDKLMQQNARLKKSIREILLHKGLTVSDYLDKREYEDATAMLREDVKMWQNQVDHLRSIIHSRGSDEIDEISKKCADLVAKIAQLEHKTAVQSVLLREAYDSNKSAVPTSDRSTSPSSPGSTLVSTSCQEEQVNLLNGRVLTLLATKKELENKLERMQIDKQALLKDLERMQSEKQAFLKDHQELSKNFEKVSKELSATKVQSEQQLKLMEAEKQALQSQLATFEEDFNIERREKLELKEYCNRSIAQHQEWIRRLANEAQKWRTSYEDERTAKDELQMRLTMLSPSSSNLLSGCASKARSSPPGSGPALSLLVSEDGPETSTGFSCPRCARKFSSEDKCAQHCKKCTDE